MPYLRFHRSELVKTGTLPLDAFDLDAEELHARFRWARRSGHPRYLWPEVPYAEWQSGLEIIADATARVLAEVGGSPRPVTVARTDGVRQEALGVASFTSGMGPLLGRWIEDGWLEAPADIGELFLFHLAHGRARADAADAVLRDVLERLWRAGIPTTLLKGAYTGRLLFPEPGTRPAQDLDLVVAPALFGEAERVLAEGRYVRAAQQWGPVRSDWVPPGRSPAPASLHVTHTRNPLNVDLHSSHARKVFGIRTLDLAPTRASDLVHLPDLPGDVSAVRGPILGMTIAAHASEDLQGLQLLRLVELILLSRAEGADRVFGEEALARARSLDALRFVYPAVALAERLAPGTVHEGFLAAAHADAPARMRTIVGEMTPANAQRLGAPSVAERFMAVRGPWELLRRVGHFLLPTSVGASPGRLLLLYAERWFRLLRRR